MKKFLVIPMVLIMCLFSFVGCDSNGGQTSQSSTDVLASVNGENITQKDFQETLDFMANAYSYTEKSENWDEFKKSVLDSFIADKLCELEAGEKEYTVSDEKFNEEKKASVDYYKSDEAFKAALKEHKITEKFFDDTLRRKLLIEQLYNDVIKDVTATEEEAKDFYDKNIKSFQHEETRDAYHIELATEEEANEVIKQLQDGKKFSKLVKKYSLDTTKNGLIATVTKTELNPDIAEQLFSIKDDGGFYEKPVKSGEHYHVLMAKNFVQAYTSSFSEVKNTVMETVLSENRSSTFESFIDELKTKYNVKYTK